MSCREVPLPDGRVRNFDVNAAAAMAESRRAISTEVPVTIEGDAPAQPASRTQEICISASILVVIVGALGLVVYFF